MASAAQGCAGTLRPTAALFLADRRRPGGGALTSAVAVSRATRRLTFSAHALRQTLPYSSLSALRRHRTYRTSPRPSTAAGCVEAMFTGIVEEMGRVKQLGPSPDGGGGFNMIIAARAVLGGVALGDSIAVNGTCLTVTHFDLAEGTLTVGLSPETLRRTNLGELREGSAVNLERALRPDSRMGGHFVQGHVDGTGEIAAVEAEGDSLRVRVGAGAELLRYVVAKGFIAVDGTSLTVVTVNDDEGWFDFVLVAYTQQKVVIAQKKVGEMVNLEVDILGKYVERLLQGRSGEAAASPLAAAAAS